MNVAIIPARGGSKRLKGKNIFPLLGKPLIQYSIEACLNSKYIEEVYVSSDDEAIIELAEACGAKTLLRPSNLADDQTPKIIVIRYALMQLRELHIQVDNVAIVQANSPELSADFLDEAFDKFIEYDLWELMSTDSNGIQNAALRIVKDFVVFNEFLSAHCGFIAKDLMDVHTIEDVRNLEERLG